MRIKDRITKEQKKKLNKMIKEERDPETFRDWTEMMGTNRDTYKRVRGAVRRK